MKDSGLRLIDELAFDYYYHLKIEITNRQTFSMVCPLMDHRNEIKMFKSQVKPRATGECFHCRVLNINLDVISMVYKSADHGKFLSIFLQ